MIRNVFYLYSYSPLCRFVPHCINRAVIFSIIFAALYILINIHFVVLYCTLLCYIALCYVILHFVMLYCTISCYIALCYDILLYYTLLCCIALCYVILLLTSFNILFSILTNSLSIDHFKNLLHHRINCLLKLFPSVYYIN